MSFASSFRHFKNKLFHRGSSKSKSHTSQNPEYKIITREDPTSGAAEAYRMLKVSIDNINVDGNIKVIASASAEQGEGKSTMLMNLAITYAEEKKKVIILDLDLRRPKVHRAFQTEDKFGIVDYFMGNKPLEDYIKHSSLGIDYICRGQKAPFPTVLLSSPKMEEVVKQLREMYDVVLIDSPPVLAVSDACIISRFCDGLVFTVCEKATHKTAAKEAVETLKQADAKILGVVVTEISKKSGYYSYRYKYYYGKYYGK